MRVSEADGTALGAPVVVAVAAVALASLGALLVVQGRPSLPAVAGLALLSAAVFAAATLRTGGSAREGATVGVAVAALAAVAWQVTAAVEPLWIAAVALAVGVAAVAYGLYRYEQFVVATAEGRA